MVTAALKKAKGWARVILVLLFWIHLCKLTLVIMGLLLCSVYAYRNTGDNGGDWSTLKTPGSNSNFSVIPNWDTLTADGNTFLAIKTFVISSLLLAMSFLQCLTPAFLFRASERNVEAKEGYKQVRYHVYAQFAHIFVEIWMLLLTMDVPVFRNMFIVITADVTLITFLHLTTCTFVHRLMFEYRNLVLNKNKVQEKDEVEEGEDWLTRYLNQKPLYDHSLIVSV